MTPKEKAIELVDKFARIDGYQDSIDLSKCEYEKQCALIAVDEMINFFINLSNEGFTFYSSIEYWQKIKTEIEKL